MQKEKELLGFTDKTFLQNLQESYFSSLEEKIFEVRSEGTNSNEKHTMSLAILEFVLSDTKSLISEALTENK